MQKTCCINCCSKICELHFCLRKRCSFRTVMKLHGTNFLKAQNWLALKIYLFKLSEQLRSPFLWKLFIHFHKFLIANANWKMWMMLSICNNFSNEHQWKLVNLVEWKQEMKIQTCTAMLFAQKFWWNWNKSDEQAMALFWCKHLILNLELMLRSISLIMKTIGKIMAMGEKLQFLDDSSFTMVWH